MRARTPLRGRFVFDSKPSPGLAPAATVFRPVVTDGGSLLQPVAQVKNDWTFEIPGPMGIGVFRFSQLPRDWFLQAILLDGVDVTDTPLDFAAFEGKRLEVRLTQRATRVSGNAIDSRGRPASAYVAVLFREDRRQWTPYSRAIAAARPDQQGRFVVQGLPTGRYLIAAVDYLEPGAELDPATLERLQRGASSIVLADGESRTIELRLAP